SGAGTGVGTTTGVGATTGGAGTGGSTGGGGTSATECGNTAPALDNRAPASDFTEGQVPGVSFDMVYVPGGMFTLGCESGSCPADTAPVSGVAVSSYHIGKTQVTADMWSAVMGESSTGFGGPTINWYEAMEFACELSRQTGR